MYEEQPLTSPLLLRLLQDRDAQGFQRQPTFVRFAGQEVASGAGQQQLDGLEVVVETKKEG